MNSLERPPWSRHILQVDRAAWMHLMAGRREARTILRPARGSAFTELATRHVGRPMRAVDGAPFVAKPDDHHLLRIRVPRGAAAELA